jgi:hypothetical protein
MGIFEKLMRRMVEYYAKERAGIGWRWQAMDSKSSAAPLGGEKTGKNPTDRGKLGAKINLLWSMRGARPSGWCSPEPTATTQGVSAIDLIVSMLLKRPAHKEESSTYDAPTKPTTPPRR